MSIMPNYYTLPHGLPVRWQDEQNGVLSAAVMAYLDAAIHNTEMDIAQFLLVRDWLTYYINAPCFQATEDMYEVGDPLAPLKASVAQLKTVGEIKTWIMKCLKLGIDPL